MIYISIVIGSFCVLKCEKITSIVPIFEGIALRGPIETKRVLDVVGDHHNWVLGRNIEGGAFHQSVAMQVVNAGDGVALATLNLFKLGLDHHKLIGLDRFAVVDIQVGGKSNVEREVGESLETQTEKREPCNHRVSS